MVVLLDQSLSRYANMETFLYNLISLVNNLEEILFAQGWFVVASPKSECDQRYLIERNTYTWTVRHAHYDFHITTCTLRHAYLDMHTSTCRLRRADFAMHTSTCTYFDMHTSLCTLRYGHTSTCTHATLTNINARMHATKTLEKDLGGLKKVMYH